MEINCFRDVNDIRVMTLDTKEGILTGTCLQDFNFNIGDELTQV